MRIGWTIPCKYLEVHDGLGTLVGAGANHYAVAEFPTTLSVWIAVQIYGHRSEVESRAHAWPSSRSVPTWQPCAPPLDMRFGFPPERAPTEPAGWEVGALIPTLSSSPPRRRARTRCRSEVDDKTDDGSAVRPGRHARGLSTGAPRPSPPARPSRQSPPGRTAVRNPPPTSSSAGRP